MLSDSKTRLRVNKALKKLGAKCCNRCQTIKSLSQFGASARDGVKSECHLCMAVRKSDAGYKTRERERIAGKRKDPKFRGRERLRERTYRASRRTDPEILRKEAAYQAERQATNTSRPLDIGDAHISKRCTPVSNGGCGRLLTRGDFYRYRRSNDQRQSRCKKCDVDRRYRAECRDAHGLPENAVCHLCGLDGMTEGNAHADHLIPRSRGGSDDASNLRWAHAACNISRGNKPLTSIQLSRIYGEAA